MSSKSESEPGPSKSRGKRFYLITYSQADENKIASRQAFGELLAREFNIGRSKVKVIHWACAKEKHADGGDHYHCSLKMNGLKKWFQVRERLDKIHGIKVNFSEKHPTYAAAYNYLLKEDPDIFHSEEHPDLAGATPYGTEQAIEANKRKGEQSNISTQSKRLRLDAYNCGTFCRSRNIKTYDELLALGEERNKEGQKDIADFIYRTPTSLIQEVISKTWGMANAKAKLEQLKVSRGDKLLEFRTSVDCICEGQWLQCAKEILALNRIDEAEFASAIYQNLLLGRGKYRNVMITGTANCGKTFMLKPLREIFKGAIFENPANTKFGWVGVDTAKVILLQDFRWSKELICWKDLLLLLEEDETVKFPTPRNTHKEDIVVANTNKVAIFATSDKKVIYNNTNDLMNQSMMDSRWKLFPFVYVIPEEEQKRVPPCGHCFASLILRT